MEEENNLIIGVFEAHEKGFGFVVPEGDVKENDIFIGPGFVCGALNGDVVEVKVLKQTDRSREGKIVRIVRHGKKELVGTFVKSKNFAFVVPDDKRFGTDIFISKKDFGKARNNHKVVVEITKYPERGRKAEGRVIEVIGGINEAGVDMLSLIKEYKLPSKFPDDVVAEAQSFGDSIDLKDLKNRRDLRQEEIFTIDGEDAKDLDDAVSVSRNADGNYLLNVHIADVSYYVKDRSKLDREARIRGTSIYMLDRVIPMLPRELSNGLCSLNSGQDRYALSVTMEIDCDGKVIDSDVYKSVVNVTERMSYTDVQKIIDASDRKILKKYEKYISHFKLMEELAHILKNKRMANGYLNLDIPESKIILDNITGKPLDVRKYETTFANEIIEQFMLTANETIAERFYWLEVPFIYRVHEEPDIDKVKEANKFLFNLGYKIHISQDTVHPSSFAKVLEEIKGKPEEKVISNLILRTLKVARYEAENIGHFGIAGKYYCHFTSPIRRYPDLFIHRVISEYFTSSEKQKERFAEKAPKYAKISSDREKVAQKVEREAESMKKAEFMEDKIGDEYDGIVSSVTNFGVFVELENTVEGLIRFQDLGDEYFIFNEENKTLTGEKSRSVYRVGDRIRVKVVEASKVTRSILFSAVEQD